MFAKRFFWVGAGLFLLALGHHLGARGATAVGLGVEGGALRVENATTTATLASNRVLIAYQTAQFGGEWMPYPFSPPSQPIPGADAIVSTTVGGGHWFVMLANGDTYSAIEDGGSGQSWTYRGNLVSGPTPAARETWGAVKGRYR